MTLAASSQRSQIIRSKFRSGEKLLSMNVGEGSPGSWGHNLTLGVCTAAVRWEGGGYTQETYVFCAKDNLCV